MTILIVDDDPEDISLFCEAIHEIDSFFKCIAARNGKEALQLLSSLVKLPDYIFLDINMPLMDGLELLGKIKEEPNTKHVKIYLHSTKITDSNYRTAMKAGASGCIRKVGSIQELANELIPVLVPGPLPVS